MEKINQILCGVGIDSMCGQKPTNTAPKEDIEESKIQYEISACGVTMQIPITDKTSESSFLVSKYQGDEELDKITPPRNFEQKFSSVRIYDADGIHDENGDALAVNRGYFARAYLNHHPDATPACPSQTCVTRWQ